MGTGTDVAMESAQVTLVKGDLRGIARARHAVGRQTMSNIKQNLFFAFVYNGAGIPLAAIGLLSPMVAALAMSLSSVSVIANALPAPDGATVSVCSDELIRHVIQVSDRVVSLQR